MNGLKYKERIEKIFQRARAMCPNITDAMLDTNGAIHYMNGNDSTPFDWNCNNRLCEFYVFHKNERGFIKALVYKNNTVDVYVYEDGGMKPTFTFKENLELAASSFANLMTHIADDNGLWNSPINALNWDVDTDDCCGITEEDEEDEEDRMKYDVGLSLLRCNKELSVGTQKIIGGNYEPTN